MPQLFMKNTGPYNGITCKHFDNETGKCKFGIEYIHNDLHSCSAGFTYCRSWTINGLSHYAYNDYYEEYNNLTLLPIAYHAIEVLRDKPSYLDLVWR